MPHTIQGAEEGQQFDVQIADEFEYAYPEGLDLKPGSQLHQFIITQVLDRTRQSSLIMKKRYDSWNEIDRTMTAYIPTDVKEAEIKQKDPRKPVSIVLPYSYAVMEIILTYLVAAFLQEPYFRYEGVSPEDTIGATLMETVVNLQCNRTKVGLALHTMLRDSLSYGLGVVTPTWEVRTGKKVRRRAVTFWSDLSEKYVLDRYEKVIDEGVVFEGNRLENIDVYRWFPDPSVSVDNIQRGEFCGWLASDNYMNLRKSELVSEDTFNVQYLQHHKGKRSQFRPDASEREIKSGGASQMPGDVLNKVDRLHMFVDLIPREWRLSTRETPERWLFTVANDVVVIQCRPVDLTHDMYPVAVCAPDFDGYTPTPVSRLEMLGGPQGLVDWLLNMHIANVRKAINDMFVVDPYLVNIADMKSGDAGKLIRLRRPAWGKSLTKEAVTQLNVNDVTRQNIMDIGFISQLMHRVGGADDPMGGQQRKGGPERLTGKEFQGTRQSGLLRYERVAKVAGMQAMQDIGYMFASHNQQLLSQETYTRAVGRWPEDLMKEYGVGPMDRIPVSPFDLLIDFDVIVKDGSVPGGSYNDAWTQLFTVIAAQPLLLMKFDIVRIFKHIARGLGAKNVDDFEIRGEPDEAVMQQVQAGNLVPAGGGT